MEPDECHAGLAKPFFPQTTIGQAGDPNPHTAAMAEMYINSVQAGF